ncbi:MAG TPA: PoNe immunity protein domain-containing protein [Burkholderiales bacterium]|nr:PoNe immunity protein domain-containing protein [Burkholderiales bacterium]
MKENRMRVRDPLGGVPDLTRFFDAYERSFRELDDYAVHIDRLIAGYSRGDDKGGLTAAYSTVLDKLELNQRRTQERSGSNERALEHKGKFSEIFWIGLMLLSFGLCLRVSRSDISRLIACCERGDRLFEALVASAAPGLEQKPSAEAFRDVFGKLYEALSASPDRRALCVHDYLQAWYVQTIDGFSFKDVHLEPDPLRYVGYWCFEAAGLVAALDIDDSAFAGHPHYPRDLVRLYRLPG